MSIRSKRTDTPAAAKAEVKAAATLSSKAGKKVMYELITPYPIVTPGGVRFLPNEPKLHEVTPWLESNVTAKIFRVIDQ